jgi:hypothetical protein
MRNLRGALSGDMPASQYGVLAGLRVQLASISTDNYLPKPERGFRAEAIGSRPRD